MNKSSVLLEPSCDETNGSSSNPDVVEGLTNRKGYGVVLGVLLLAIPIAVHYIGNIYNVPYLLFKTEFESILGTPNYDKERFINIYDEFANSLLSNKLLNHKWVLLLFICFAFMAFFVNQEDGIMNEPSKLTIASIVGILVFILKFIPSVMSFFENVFGYFFMNIFGKLSLSLSLKNDTFTEDSVDIKLNKLITLFTIENLGEKFNSIGTIDDTTNNGELFAISNAAATNNETSKYKLFEYLLNMSILKRATGEAGLLVLTTLITIALFQ